MTYNDAFEILVNPYPIFEDHLTVPLRWHERQQIKPYYGDLLDIVSDLSGYAFFIMALNAALPLRTTCISKLGGKRNFRL